MTRLSDLVNTGLVAEDVSLSALTTYKMGGPARWFADIDSSDALQQVVAALAEEPRSAPELPVVVLGRGSNMVIADGGYQGLVIRLSGEFAAIAVEGELVHAGGAAPLGKVARAAAAQDRGGLEFFVGVPGSVGGAVRMNAGCHGSETSDWLDAVDVMDLRTGESRLMGIGDLRMGYRTSVLRDRDLVVRASFRTVERARADGEVLMREITKWRKEHQPGGTLNAGSVFKNPAGDSAGRIIDELGLKGLRRGGASVSTKHANFFVSDPGTKAQDVRDLVDAVRRRVADATGVVLVPEVKFVGEFATSDADSRGDG